MNEPNFYHRKIIEKIFYHYFAYNLVIFFFKYWYSPSGPVPITDMQTPLPLLRNDHIYTTDAQCAEMDEKSIFRFLQFYFLNYGRLCAQNWQNFQVFQP